MSHCTSSDIGDLWSTFDNLYSMASSSERNGYGEAGETGTNDNDMLEGSFC
jgi:hypothetical protein